MGENARSRQKSRGHAEGILDRSAMHEVVAREQDIGFNRLEDDFWIGATRAIKRLAASNDEPL